MNNFIVSINTEDMISSPGDYLVLLIHDLELEELINLFHISFPTSMRMANSISWKSWFPSVCFHSSLNFSLITLPNGDTVGNYLNNNGYCFLPREASIPPGGREVIPDIRLNLENKTMTFVFTIEEGSGALYTTLPFGLDALNTKTKHNIGLTKNEYEQEQKSTEEIGKCLERNKGSGLH